jgi:hypothetical protein
MNWLFITPQNQLVRQSTAHSGPFSLCEWVGLAVASGGLGCPALTFSVSIPSQVIDEWPI